MRKESLTQGILSSTFFKIASKVMGLSRQALIAAWFGLSQDLDYIDVCVGLLLISLSLIGDVFELVFTPKLIRYLKEDENAAAGLTRSVITRFFLLSAGILTVLVICSGLILPYFASGYTPEQLARIRYLFYYFVPGGLVILPFAALSATARALRQFSLSFLGEFAISTGMLLGLFLPFSGAIRVPVSYSVGQLAGCFFLLWMLRKFLFRKDAPPEKMIEDSSALSFWTGIRTIVLINCAHIIFILAEKNYGSHMPTGTLAAFAYAGLLFSAASTLPGFAGIYFTALCENLSRDRLNHLIGSTLLYASVVVAFLYFGSFQVLSLLFQRGHMDESAIRSAAILLQIMSLRMLTELPYQLVYRTYFILNRPRFPTFSRYGVNLISAFVAYLMLIRNVGPAGLAIHFLLQGILMLLTDSYGLRHYGLGISYRTALRALSTTAIFFLLALGVSFLEEYYRLATISYLLTLSSVLAIGFLMLLFLGQSDPLLGSVFRKLIVMLHAAGRRLRR